MNGSRGGGGVGWDGTEVDGLEVVGRGGTRERWTELWVLLLTMLI